MISKDDIKDILIHFEEAGYSIAVSDPSIWGLNTKVDVPTPVGISVGVTISKIKPKPVLSFEEWSWVNITIKTALSRMNQKGIEKEVKLDCNRIIINLKEQLVVLKNIGSLVKIIKEFNTKALGGVIRMKYDQKSSIKINFYRESNKDLEPMFDILSKDFNIKDLRQNGVLMNRFGLPSGNQVYGLVASLEPKNFEIYE
jgi:hypothetical protein